MNISKSYHVMMNDLAEVFSSKAIYVPMVMIPLFFSVVLPLFTFYISVYNVAGVVRNIFASGSANAPVISGGIAFMSYFSVYVLGPIFLTLPIITASVIAADSFAGEKERKTSEALLSTPLTVGELLVGKVLSSFIPALGITLAVFIIYGSITNVLAVKAFSEPIFPTAPWLMMIVLAPFLAIATIGMVVLVSAHASGIKEAQQISSLIVMPVLIIPFISILGVANLTVPFFLELLAVLIALDLVVIYFGVISFKKESIL